MSAASLPFNVMTLLREYDHESSSRRKARFDACRSVRTVTRIVHGLTHVRGCTVSSSGDSSAATVGVDHVTAIAVVMANRHTVHCRAVLRYRTATPLKVRRFHA